MKVKEFKKGMKVKVINWKDMDRKRPNHWNSGGHMDKWQGKVLTIKSINRDRLTIRVEEDACGHNLGVGWTWFDTDFVGIGGLEEWNIEWEEF